MRRRSEAATTASKLLALLLAGGALAVSPERLVAQQPDLEAEIPIADPGQAQRDKAAPAEKAAPSGPLARIVTIGASVSDGFANGMPLARYLNEAIVVPHRRVERAATSMFFLRPSFWGASQVRRARRLDATVVIAVDFLFWFAYGPQRRLRRSIEESGHATVDERRSLDALRGDQRRRDKYDRELRSLSVACGLRELEKLDVPLVLGDIPDMTGASARMLRASNIPPVATQKLVNAQIRAWAKARPAVRMLPLADRVRAMKRGELMIPAQGEQPAVAVPAEVVMSKDRLHPSKLGVLLFVDELVRILAESFPAHAKGLRFDTRARIRARGFGSLFDAGAPRAQGPRKLG